MNAGSERSTTWMETREENRREERLTVPRVCVAKNQLYYPLIFGINPDLSRALAGRRQHNFTDTNVLRLGIGVFNGVRHVFRAQHFTAHILLPALVTGF